MAAPAGYDPVKWDTAVTTVLPHFPNLDKADRWLNQVAANHRQDEKQGNAAAHATLVTWIAPLAPLPKPTFPVAFDSYMRL